MGKQVRLHLFQEDFETLFDFIQKDTDTSIVEMFGTSPLVEPIKPEKQAGQILCLWNHLIMKELTRKLIPESQSKSYRVDETTLPVLEFNLSHLTVWNNKPALLQGRIYGNFRGKCTDFERWYHSIVRYIHKSFINNPTKLGGYIGKHAYDWFRREGVLLPAFLPPLTKEWVTFVESQHN